MSTNYTPPWLHHPFPLVHCTKFIISTSGSNLSIINLKPDGASPPGTVQKRPMKAEAAIMNPISKVIALRSGGILQVFNLELQTKMKSFTSPSSILFWR